MNYVEKVLPFFPKAHIYRNDEIIIEPKNNVYFRVDNINNDHEFDCKMLEWLSRPSCKGLTPYWIKFMRRGLNGYFCKNWSQDDMREIYTRLGNGVNRTLCSKFINSGFDINILKASPNEK